jgi:hypothetical protein
VIELYETKPRTVEVMKWDGRLDSAEAIMDWIRSKGEVPRLIKRGERFAAYDSHPLGSNGIELSRWSYANKRWGVIVYDPQYPQPGKFFAWTQDEFDKYYWFVDVK